MVSSSGRFGGRFGVRVRSRSRGVGPWFGRIALALGLGGVLAPPAHAAPVKPDKPAAAAPEAKEKAAPRPRKARRADQREKVVATTDAVKKDAAKKDESQRDATKKKDESKKDAARKDAAKKAEGKRAASSKGGGKKKTVAARTDASRRRDGKARKDKARKDPPKPCLGPVTQIDRGGLEAERIILVDCKGKPREEARKQLSILARPWGAARPSAIVDAPPAGPKAPPLTRSLRSGEVAPSVRLVDPGLLARVDALSRRYPDRPISLVSGYRPQSRGSLHQTARALDLRIAGVPNHELVAACRALADTGCGYYPNSSFIHVDVRSPGTGSVTWIDASGPGEAPRYVTAWPPPAEKPEGAPAQKVAEAPETKEEVATPSARAEKKEAPAEAPAKDAPPKQDEAKVEEQQDPAPAKEAGATSSAASPEEGG